MGKWSREEWDQIGEAIAGERIRGMPAQVPCVSSVNQNYVIGSRMEDDMGRVFRYSEVGDGTYGVTAVATQLRTAYGAYSAIVAAVIENSVAVAAAVAGARTVTYGPAIAAFPANHFQNGLLQYIDATGAFTGTARIASHPAAILGGNCVLTLKDPLPLAIALGGQLILNRNMYADIRSMRQEAIEGVGVININYNSQVGIPLVNALAGEFFWLQVRGPAFLVPAGGNEGTLMYDRLIDFDFDGSGQLHLLEYFPAVTQQCRNHAGYMIPCTQSALVAPAVAAAHTGCLYIMLEVGN